MTSVNQDLNGIQGRFSCSIAPQDGNAGRLIYGDVLHLHMDETLLQFLEYDPRYYRSDKAHFSLR
jgi:hypothetical protein